MLRCSKYNSNAYSGLEITEDEELLLIGKDVRLTNRSDKGIQVVDDGTVTARAKDFVISY